jgi:hypothetical protein
VRKAVAILFRFAAEAIGQRLREACGLCGVELEVLETTQWTMDHWNSTPNLVLFWDKKFPWTWYETHRREGKNFLFLENGLVGQSEGFLIDSEGYFTHSRICAERRYDHGYTDADLDRLKKVASNWLGMTLFGGCDPTGPLMFACQQQGDASILHYFPGPKTTDTRMKALQVLVRAYAGKRVLVRPHPWGGNAWEDIRQQVDAMLPATWTVEMPVPGVKVYTRLPQCRGLVTVNSTVATEALILGMPVAVFGYGAFTGSGTMLECTEDAALVNGVEAFAPDREKVLRYLCACLRQQVRYRETTAAELAAHEEFQRWVQCLKE